MLQCNIVQCPRRSICVWYTLQYFCLYPVLGGSSPTEINIRDLYLCKITKTLKDHVMDWLTRWPRHPCLHNLTQGRAGTLEHRHSCPPVDYNFQLMLLLLVFCRMIISDIFSYFVKQMFHWLVHREGRERCRFSTCRRCTLGAGSFSLSLAPSNHIIHSLLLKIIWLSVF